MSTTQAALKAARQCIEQDRAALVDCHQSPVTGAVEDADGLAGLAEYDAVLATIDAALAQAEAARAVKPRGPACAPDLAMEVELLRGGV